MATCELWVRGFAENGGRIFVDTLVFASYDSGRAFPSLSVINTDDFGRGTFTRYRANPAWSIDEAGWYSSPEFYLKNCQRVPPDQPFDCLNGGCIPKTAYGTPGFYANLASCQSGCARNSNCRGKCVSPEDMAALEQAANQLQAKICT